MLPPILTPFRETDADRFDRIKAAHLLNRAAFGGTDQQIQRVVELGPQKSVDWLVDFYDVGIDEVDPADGADLSGLDGYPTRFADLRKLLAGKTEEQRKELQMRLRRANGQAMRQIVQWWIGRMIRGPHPLQEKLTLFWHGHFTTSARDERLAELMWRQNDLLRRYAAGNFAQLLSAISRDPAMLDYLNNTQNRKAHPNENFAREVMELFTLGIGNYAERDVTEAARAFTGWSHDGTDYRFNSFNHDRGVKQFLGQTGDFNGQDILDIILRQPACGRYIAARLLNFFVMENPPAEAVQALGELLWQSNYELRPVLKTLFCGKLFYSPEAIGRQIKSPVQLLVGTAHQLQLPAPAAQFVRYALEQMGQVPLDPPNVKGWPGGKQWISTNSLLQRYNLMSELAGKTAFEDCADQAAAVRRFVDRLIGRPVDDAKLRELSDALGRVPARQRSARLAQWIVVMPEYQLC